MEKIILGVQEVWKVVHRRHPYFFGQEALTKAKLHLQELPIQYQT